MKQKSLRLNPRQGERVEKEGSVDLKITPLLLMKQAGLIMLLPLLPSPLSLRKKKLNKN
jgi:hypothetical protein